MNRIFYIIMMMCCTLTAAAQVYGFRIGGRLGLGESTINCSAISTTEPKLVISGGIATNYQFTKNLGINADFLLTASGAKAAGYTSATNIFGAEQRYHYKEKYDLVYAEAPLTAQLTSWIGDLFLKAYAGPGMNFKLMATQTRTYDDPNYNDQNGFMNRELDMRNIYYSMVYGVGIGARAKNDQLYFLDLRLNRAITPNGTINGVQAYGNYYCISAGYVF